MSKAYTILGTLYGLLCSCVAIIISGMLPGAAVYLLLMAACWFGMVHYAGKMH